MRPKHLLALVAALCALAGICRGQPADPQPKMEKVPFLGLSVRCADAVVCAQLGLPKDTGLSVGFVAPDSPAAKAGIQMHDVLTGFDAQILMLPRQLSVLVANSEAGATVELHGVRHGKPFSQKVVVGSTERRPAPFGNMFGRGTEGEMAPFAAMGGDLFGGPQPMPLRQQDERHWSELVERVSQLAREGGPEAAEKVQDLLRDFHARPPVGPGEQPPVPGGMMPGMDGMGGGMFGGAGGMDGGMMVERGAATATMTHQDREHVLTLTRQDGKSHLLVKNKKGNVLFDGPVDTEEQRRLVPPEVQGKLERMERRRPRRAE